MTLMVDDKTLLPAKFPEIHVLQVVHQGRTESLFDPVEQGKWLQSHVERLADVADDSEAWQLLLRLCRVVLRQNWIRDVEDDWAGRLLNDEHWPRVKEVLERHHMLHVREGVGVGGPKSDFYRIADAASFLSSAAANSVISEVRRELA
jgi:hypothetical protein